MAWKKIYATKINENSIQDLEGVGTLREENGNLYKWVKVSGSYNANYIATYTNVNEVVQGAPTSGSRPIAGIFQSGYSGSGVSYCWILIKGFATFVPNTNYSPTVGDAIVPNSSGKAILATTEKELGMFVVDATNKIAKVNL